MLYPAELLALDFQTPIKTATYIKFSFCGNPLKTFKIAVFVALFTKSATNLIVVIKKRLLAQIKKNNYFGFSILVNKFNLATKKAVLGT